MTIQIRIALPPREIVVCNLEEHNSITALLKAQGLLKEKWTLIIVDSNDEERAAKIFQETMDEKRITMVYMTESLDHELYVQIRDFCIANGIPWSIVSEGESN